MLAVTDMLLETERQPAPPRGRPRRSGRRRGPALAAVPAHPRGEVRRRHRPLQADAVRPRQPGRLDRVRRLGAAPRPGTARRRRPAAARRTCSTPRGFAPTRSRRPSPSPPRRSCPEHFQEVADRRVEHVEKTLAAVHDRLTKEIAFWSDRWIKLKEDAGGRQGRAAEPRQRPAHARRPRKAGSTAARRNCRRCGTSRTARRSCSAGRWSCRPGCSGSSAAKARPCRPPTPRPASGSRRSP